jgi:hypothetical protein
MKLRMLASLVFTAAGLLARRTIEQPAPAKEPQISSTSAPTHQSKLNHIFDEMIPLLHRKTLVPLRLPEYVTYSDDKETPLYGIVEVAEPASYSIQLAWIKDCNSGNACHVGYIGGSKTAPHPRDKSEVPVTLSGGITGSFVDFDCGAHCDDASLYWTESGYYYGISLKAGDKKTLIRMANSAIRGRTSRATDGSTATPHWIGLSLFC